jgi:hypothetical protein
MIGAGLLGPRQRVLLFSFRLFGLLVDFPGCETDLCQQQRNLRTGELLALGAEDPEVEQADLLVLELQEALQPTVFGLQVGDDLGQVGCGQ